MKLFVWEHVLRDYSPRMTVVYAENRLQAYEIIKEKFPRHVAEELLYKEPKVVTKPDGFYVYGGG